MFGKMMNNYYYGKSGKGDFRKEDLPRNRWQLFWEMLRVRLSALCRMNLMTIAAWLPLIIVIGQLVFTLLNVLNTEMQFQDYLENGVLTENFTEESVARLAESGITDMETMNEASAQVLMSMIMPTLLWAIPCIALTGPVQAGLAYVTRNWSRDEHAFIWSDFKDAVKENWKQGLGVSFITSLLPVVLYVGWQFYGQQTESSMFFIVPQTLIIMLGAVWMLGVTFMYPMMVSYKVTFPQLIKNSLILAIGRLPQTVGVRLVMLLPTALCLVIFLFTGSLLALLALVAYYFLIGITLARFVYASYTNGVFDKLINSRMEGVQVNRGMASESDEDEGDDEDEESADPQ